LDRNIVEGYLVFSRVIKVGFGVGAETGEGALRVRGRSVEYYRTTAGRFLTHQASPTR